MLKYNEKIKELLSEEKDWYKHLETFELKSQNDFFIEKVKLINPILSLQLKDKLFFKLATLFGLNTIIETEEVETIKEIDNFYDFIKLADAVSISRFADETRNFFDVPYYANFKIDSLGYFLDKFEKERFDEIECESDVYIYKSDDIDGYVVSFATDSSHRTFTAIALAPFIKKYKTKRNIHIIKLKQGENYEALASLAEYLTDVVLNLPYNKFRVDVSKYGIDVRLPETGHAILIPLNYIPLDPNELVKRVRRIYKRIKIASKIPVVGELFIPDYNDFKIVKGIQENRCN